MVNDGIANLALEFINAFILKIPKFSSYTFLIDVLDSLIKNFICYFREKVSCCKKLVLIFYYKILVLETLQRCTFLFRCMKCFVYVKTN